MALILAALTQSAISAGMASAISSNLDDFDFKGWPPAASSVASKIGAVSVAVNLPVTTTPREISASVLKNYTGDFYDRIHIQPTDISFGTISTPQSATVEIWNAFRESVDLTAIIGTETGLSISEPIIVPGSMRPLQSRVWTVTVTKDGTPELETALVWQFDAPAVPVSVGITATRIATWPFKPLTPMVEAQEWSTEVLRPRAGEQRLAMRIIPRRTFTLEHAATQDQIAAARTLARQNVRFLAPDWIKAVSMTAQTGAAVALPDGMAIVWRSWDDYEQTAIASGALSTVTHPGPAIVAPLAICRMIGGAQIGRGAGNWARLSATLETPDFPDTEAATLYPIWQGLPAINQPIKVSSGSFSEPVQLDVETFDNGQNTPDDYILRTLPDVTFNVRWHEFKPANIAALRAWIASRRGKLKAFWLPSWAHDLALVARSAGGVIVTGYAGDEANLAFNIGGTLYFRQVSTATAVSNGTQLVLDSALPVGDILMVSYVRRVRFNSDRIEYNHAAGAGVSVSVQCVEVQA